MRASGKSAALVRDAYASSIKRPCTALNLQLRSSRPSRSPLRISARSALRPLPRAPASRSTDTHVWLIPTRSSASLGAPTERMATSTLSSRPGGRSERTVSASGASQCVAIASARRMPSDPIRGSPLSFASARFRVTPEGGGSAPTFEVTIPIARRPPNGTTTASPISTSPCSGGK